MPNLTTIICLVTDYKPEPNIIAIGYDAYHHNGELFKREHFYICPGKDEFFRITPHWQEATGITMQTLKEEGKPITEVLERLAQIIEESSIVAMPNYLQDSTILKAEFKRNGTKVGATQMVYKIDLALCALLAMKVVGDWKDLPQSQRISPTIDFLHSLIIQKAKPQSLKPKLNPFTLTPKASELFWWLWNEDFIRGL